MKNKKPTVIRQYTRGRCDRHSIVVSHILEMRHFPQGVLAIGFTQRVCLSFLSQGIALTTGKPTSFSFDVVHVSVETVTEGQHGRLFVEISLLSAGFSIKLPENW